MTREERITYLGNVVQVAGADGEVSPREGEAIERVRKELDASADDLAEALQSVARGTHSIAPVGRFSDRIRNLEDMIFVAVCDGRFSGEEKPEVVSFAREVGVSQTQLNAILKEARERVSPEASSDSLCPGCGKAIPPESRFCPHCGRDLRDASI
jgi:uncharacterized tellurite resistance protein B-like protein